MIFLKSRSLKTLAAFQALCLLAGSAPAFAAKKKANRYIATEEVGSAPETDIQEVVDSKRSELEDVKQILANGYTVEEVGGNKKLYVFSEGTALVAGISGVGAAVMAITKGWELKKANIYNNYREKLAKIDQKIEPLNKSNPQAAADALDKHLKIAQRDLESLQKDLETAREEARTQKEYLEARRAHQEKIKKVKSELASAKKEVSKLERKNASKSKGQKAQQLTEAQELQSRLKGELLSLEAEVEKIQKENLKGMENQTPSDQKAKLQQMQENVEVAQRQRAKVEETLKELRPLQEKRTNLIAEIAKKLEIKPEQVENKIKDAVWEKTPRSAARWRTATVGLLATAALAAIARHFTKPDETEIALTEEEYFRLVATAESLELQISALEASLE